MEKEYEWDERKARKNIKKHGVTFEEAVAVFRDLLAITIPDPLHSEMEDRYLELGECDPGKLLVVVFSERENRIRIISARPATRKESLIYEESKQRRR